MGFLTTVIGGIAGLFLRKVSTVDKETGEEKEVTRPTGFGYGSAGLLSFLLLYHLLFWPWLNYHFPHYGFPPLDLSIISAVLAGIGG